MIHKSRVIALVLLLVVGTGCSKPGPELVTVEGTARMDGKPLSGVLVSFLPEVAKGNTGRQASGMTDENGRFRLTYDDPENPRPGAVVGWHVVIVSDPEMENLDNPKRFQRRQIPQPYRMATQSPLSQEVKAGGSQTIDIEIKR